MATGEVVELSAQQRREHEADERIIDAGLETFIEVGRALVRIRDRRSYVLTHSTFGAYVRDRFRFNVPYAYNLMLGAEVITVLDERQVEPKPANARVAYELRTLLDDPDELVKAWQRTVEQYGDKPIGREVARALRGEQPVRRHELPRVTGNGSGELDGDLALFDDALTRVGDGLEAAKSVQRNALANADAATLALWSRRVKQLRTMAADLQAALRRKT